jgi:hypothetical protein
MVIAFFRNILLPGELFLLHLRDVTPLPEDFPLHAFAAALAL